MLHSVMLRCWGIPCTTAEVQWNQQEQILEEKHHLGGSVLFADYCLEHVLLIFDCPFLLMFPDILHCALQKALNHYCILN